jgi:hypothetical protein
LYWCGASSSKHDGKLKRICAPVISLLHSLIKVQMQPAGEDGGNTNIFYEKFVQIPVADLLLINFAKHIEPITNKSSGPQMTLKSATKFAAKTAVGSSSASGSTRVGGYDDALHLLKIILTDHRSLDGDPDPVDLLELIPAGEENRKCREKVEQYMQRTAADMVSRFVRLFVSCT